MSCHESNEQTIENHHALSETRYVVWTQAGFKQALKKYRELGNAYGECHGFPEVYPSVVKFTEHDSGCWWIHADCTPLNTEIENTEALLAQYKEIDRQHKLQLEKQK